jgi:hypothetical protein
VTSAVSPAIFVAVASCNASADIDSSDIATRATAARRNDRGIAALTAVYTEGTARSSDLVTSAVSLKIFVAVASCTASGSDHVTSAIITDARASSEFATIVTVTPSTRQACALVRRKSARGVDDGLCTRLFQLYRPGKKMDKAHKKKEKFR